MNRERIEIEDGVGIYFDTSGEGLVPEADTMLDRPTVLLLHGGPGADHSAFKPDFGRLADVAQVVYIDQRGQGRSDRVRSGRSTPGLTTWCGSATRPGIDNPIVVGLSFGGIVAQHYASRHVGHPAGLVLMSTMARFDLDASVEEFRRLGSTDAAEAARAAYTEVCEENRERYFEICGPLYTRRTGSVFGSSRVIWNHELAEHFIDDEERAVDFRAGLASVVAPCLILVGADDPITPISASEQIRDSLTSTVVDCRILEDCGHGVHRDQPAETLSAIASFIEEHSPHN